MIDRKKLEHLIARLERQRGPYMGDGINPGFTTHEVLEFLRPLLNVVDQNQKVSYSNESTAKDTDVRA